MLRSRVQAAASVPPGRQQLSEHHDLLTAREPASACTSMVSLPVLQIVVWRIVCRQLALLGTIAKPLPSFERQGGGDQEAAAIRSDEQVGWSARRFPASTSTCVPGLRVRERSRCRKQDAGLGKSGTWRYPGFRSTGTILWCAVTFGREWSRVESQRHRRNPAAREG